jgi:hypothetical protein
MRISAGVLAASALISIGCGGSGGSGGTVAAPTAPSVPAAEPPTVNVGGGPQTALWNGHASDDQGGSGTAGMGLQQTGAQVTGSIYVQVLGHSGPFTGTISANTLSFNFSVGGDFGKGCGNAISGTATVSSVNMMTPRPNTMNTMTATFSGKDCTGSPVTNGNFTVSLQDPSLQDQTGSATRFPIAGTWKAPLPSSLGGGSWTWTLAQDGDVNGGNLTGSVTVSPDNTLHLGTGTVTGTFTNLFPGPPERITAVSNVSFTGACPATLMVNWGNLSPDGLQLVAATFSGSNCNGPFATFKPSLRRQ